MARNETQCVMVLKKLPCLSRKTEIISKNFTCSTHTLLIFQVLHADTMHMTLKSNRCRYILHGWCEMILWMEGHLARDEKGQTVIYQFHLSFVL